MSAIPSGLFVHHAPQVKSKSPPATRHPSATMPSPKALIMESLREQPVFISILTPFKFISVDAGVNEALSSAVEIIPHSRLLCTTRSGHSHGSRRLNGRRTFSHSFLAGSCWSAGSVAICISLPASVSVNSLFGNLSMFRFGTSCNLNSSAHFRTTSAEHLVVHLILHVINWHKL